MTRRSSHRQNHRFRSTYKEQMRAKFPRTARSQNDDSVRPGRPILRHSHQTAAATQRRCQAAREPRARRMPPEQSVRPALRSAATWSSTTAGDRIRALTAPHPIKLTSTNCHSAWQPNPGRDSTYRSGKPVQTTGTTSFCHVRSRTPLGSGS